MTDHTCCNLEELEKLRAENEKMRAYIKHGMAMNVGFIPFICGTLGETKLDGLADGYLICPAYGSDIVGVYKKVEARNPEF